MVDLLCWWASRVERSWQRPWWQRTESSWTAEYCYAPKAPSASEDRRSCKACRCLWYLEKMIEDGPVAMQSSCTINW